MVCFKEKNSTFLGLVTKSCQPNNVHYVFFGNLFIHVPFFINEVSKNDISGAADGNSAEFSIFFYVERQKILTTKWVCYYAQFQRKRICRGNLVTCIYFQCGCRQTSVTSQYSRKLPVIDIYTWLYVYVHDSDKSWWSGILRYLN